MEREATKIKCPDCNAEVDTMAEACPQCGKQMIKKQGVGPGTIGLLILIAVVAVGVWLWQSST